MKGIMSATVLTITTSVAYVSSRYLANLQYDVTVPPFDFCLIWTVVQCGSLMWLWQGSSWRSATTFGRLLCVRPPCHTPVSTRAGKLLWKSDLKNRAPRTSFERGGLWPIFNAWSDVIIIQGRFLGWGVYLISQCFRAGGHSPSTWPERACRVCTQLSHKDQLTNHYQSLIVVLYSDGNASYALITSLHLTLIWTWSRLPPFEFDDWKWPLSSLQLRFTCWSFNFHWTTHFVAYLRYPVPTNLVVNR